MNLTFAGGFTAKDLSDDSDPFLKSKLFTYILMDIFENGLKSTQSYVSRQFYSFDHTRIDCCSARCKS